MLATLLRAVVFTLAHRLTNDIYNTVKKRKNANGKDKPNHHRKDIE